MAVTIPDWLTRENLSVAVLILCAFGFAVFMLVESVRNPLIRCTDIMTGDNGRLASNKTFQCLAFLLSAWAMVYMTLQNRADAIAWGAWVAIWAGATLTNKVVNNKAVEAAAKIAVATDAPPPIPQVSDKS
jgi:hypothetical protein